MALCNGRRGVGDPGFTLVELVVTLVIIGALAAVSAPLFFNAQTFQQSGFFNETIAAVRYAQKLAIASCSPVRVNFAAGEYRLFGAAAPPANCDNPCTVGGTGTPVADPTDESRNFVRAAPAGVTLTATDVVFCPLGNANLGSTDPNVTINVGTGQLRVWATTGFVERL